MKFGKAFKAIETRVQGTLEELMPKGISPLGTLIYQQVRFLGGNYTTPQGETITYEELVLNNVTVGYNLPKDIVRTKVNGLNGEVLEYFSRGAIDISLVGILVGGIGKLYPKDKVIQLNAIHQINQSVTIVNSFLNNNLGVKRAAIIGLQLPASTDYRVVPFNMQLISDFDDDLDFSNFVLQ